jgi:hypothetical protein
MNERMTSRAEAAWMKGAIEETVADLERQGFDRSQIGACLVGIGLALVAVASGNVEARRLLLSVGDALSASEPDA